MKEFLNIYDIETILTVSDYNVGICYGISDPNNKIWAFAVYIGKAKFVILYEKGKGINQPVFDLILSAKLISKKSLRDICDSKEHAKDLRILREDSNLEFNIYDLNLIETALQNEITPNDLLEILRHNFKQIDILEEGDVISFDRSLYSHHALLTDSLRMIVTHRSGEPENPGGLIVSSRSLLGFPTEKAGVTEDFLIEVAGFRKIKKANDLYDKLAMPRSKEEILSEAKRRIGEMGYSLTTRNCQNFVSEVRNGKSHSPEVKGVINGAMYTLGLGFMAASALVFSRVSNSVKKEKSKEEVNET